MKEKRKIVGIRVSPNIGFSPGTRRYQTSMQWCFYVNETDIARIIDVEDGEGHEHSFDDLDLSAVSPEEYHLFCRCFGRSRRHGAV